MQKENKTNTLLLGLAGMLESATDTLDAFLFSAGSASLLSRNLKMRNRDYHSTLQGLQRNGYVRRVNEDQFLITPKAIRKIKVLRIEQSEWTNMSWDGKWRVILFDIPEKMKAERNFFRSVIKRKGFIGIQHSVFIVPFADMVALDDLRRNLKIEKYVSFMIAETFVGDDDSALKKRFKV